MRALIRLIFLLLVVLSLQMYAREYRVNQVPNGTVFRCAMCHINPNGGGANSVFGVQVRTGFLDAIGNVLWGPALAALDADGDGETNGQELQDPDGLWIIGIANPGAASLVTNPGDATSTDVDLVDLDKTPDDFQLMQNYPNPFNPQTKIGFKVPVRSNVALSVFNSRGQLLRTIIDAEFSPGDYSVTFDGRDRNGSPLVSGIYFCQLQASSFTKSMPMILMR